MRSVDAYPAQGAQGRICAHRTNVSATDPPHAIHSQSTRPRVTWGFAVRDDELPSRFLVGALERLFRDRVARKTASVDRTRRKRLWCRLRDSNPRPPDYKSGALPTVLSRPRKRCAIVIVGAHSAIVTIARSRTGLQFDAHNLARLRREHRGFERLSRGRAGRVDPVHGARAFAISHADLQT